MHKLSIGFITHNETTAKYLPYFLPSIFNSSFLDYKLFCLDNSRSEDNHNRKYLDKYNELNYQWSDENVGFARGYNELIDKAIRNKSKYFLAINPDVILDVDCIKKMIEAMEENENLSSVSPKVYRWDFEQNKKENIIDTCGLVNVAPLRFEDLAQGQIDVGQNKDKKIVGPSGAVAMYRIEALKKVKDEYGYFDSRMFMYKEDCDLAYRLEQAGFESSCVREAHAFHDRTAVAGGRYIWDVIKNRKNKSKQVNKWSFRNQQIIFSKHWKTQSLKEKANIIFYQFRLFSYAMLFEPYLLKDYFANKELRK